MSNYEARQLKAGRLSHELRQARPHGVLNRLARGVRVAANHGPVDEVTDADR